MTFQQHTFQKAQSSYDNLSDEDESETWEEQLDREGDIADMKRDNELREFA